MLKNRFCNPTFQSTFEKIFVGHWLVIPKQTLYASFFLLQKYSFLNLKEFV